MYTTYPPRPSYYRVSTYEMYSIIFYKLNLCSEREKNIDYCNRERYFIFSNQRKQINASCNLKSQKCICNNIYQPTSNEFASSSRQCGFRRTTSTLASLQFAYENIWLVVEISREINFSLFVP